jgi:hypothetical protein
MRGVWWIFEKLSATMKQQFLSFSYSRCGTFFAQSTAGLHQRAILTKLRRCMPAFVFQQTQRTRK